MGKAAGHALRTVGILFQATPRATDDGVEIWEVIRGVGRMVGDPIAAYVEREARRK